MTEQNKERKVTFTDEDVKRLKEDSEDHTARCSRECPWREYKLKALLARLEAAEDYKRAHPCTRREPHGATDVKQTGCQFDEAWRQVSGK